MSEIDWDNAPEGATHYVNGSICPFEKRVGDDWYYWKEKSSAWIKIYNVIVDERIKTSTMHIIERPSPAWSGEGLPPVGVDIQWFSSVYGWIGGKVIAHDEQTTIVRHNDGYEGCYLHNLKPCKTPEQIAADEREKALREACEVVGCAPGSMYCIEVVKKLIDAGYRKP